MDDTYDQDNPRGADDRPRGVSKARLTDLNLKSKLSIFYRPNRNAAMVPLENDIPIEAAKVFCDRIKSHLGDDVNHSYVVTGGEPAAYKMIFAWIKDCVQTESIEKFPDIPEPEHDPFTQTLNVIVAGERLRVPAGSLSFHLRKRMNNCARKKLMPFTQAREFYDMDSEAYNLDLKDIACTSIFNAWWDARLDESVNPDLMEELSAMRDDLKELDEDLHEACRVREEEVRKKWAEKKAKKAAEQAGEEYNGDNVESNNTAGARDWDNAATTAPVGDWNSSTAASSGWDTPGDTMTHATTSTSAEWQSENNHPVTCDGAGNQATHYKDTRGDCATGDDHKTARSNNWADEMNEPVPESFQTVPMVQW